MLVVLSESTFHDGATINGRELASSAETARLFGCRVYPLPPDFSQCEDADGALAYVPDFDPPVSGIWVGYIPSAERYAAVYAAASAKGVRILNAPEQYRRAMEFDQFYPLLAGLTPRSLVLRSLEDCGLVAGELGYPVFVKGAVKSNKEQGWKACVAESEAELRALAAGLLERQGRSRGCVIARELAPLRLIETDYAGFPLGREYRVFIYRGQVVALGFYWDEYADSAALAPAEEERVRALALEAAARLEVPFLAVDVGQLTSGEWIIIETGDAQFSGLSQVPVLELWGRLTQLAG
jgi:hypothetical protein